MQLRQSETRTIRRSVIKLNPYNPKRHKDEEVRRQLQNFKKHGYLGGIVWNERTGNLVDGHRRIQAMDIFYKYDGGNDYDVKVEVVDFDRKQELNQLTYMALGNTKADYNLVARYATDIDPKDAGISEEDYSKIMSLVDTPQVEDMPDFSNVFSPVHDLNKDTETNEEIVERHENKPKMTREEVRAEKQFCTDVATERHDRQDLYAFIIFDSEEQKQQFCDMIQRAPENSMKITGAEILSAFR